MQTIYDLVRLQAERTPDQIAIVDDRSQRHLTYRALMDEVDVIAAGLAERGVRAGTRVATCLGNVIEHGLAILALARLGAVPAVINVRLDAYDVAALIEQGDIRGAIVDADRRLAEEVGAVLGHTAAFYTVGGAIGGAPDFKMCKGERQSLPPVPRPDPEDPSIIFYTSGTTGLPKGVVIPHRATEPRFLFVATQAGLRYGPHNRALGAMPLGHCIGFYGVYLATLALGGTYYVLSRFDPVRAMELVEKNKLTYVFAAPTLYSAIVNAKGYRPNRMRSIELCLYGGSSIDPALLDHMAKNWKAAQFRHIYGTTEAMCSGFNADPVGNPAALRPGFYSRVRYVALGGGPDDEIGPGETGELLIDASSAATFTEYLNNEGATEERLRGGWYYTGDAIKVDKNGDFILDGRVDDIIRSGGESIHPLEVEETLKRSAHVADCAVVGLDDPHWGQIVVACVVAADENINAQMLDSYCKKTRLANFKRPKAYYFVEEIPRNPGNGNVLRRVLRDQAELATHPTEGYVAVAG